MEATSEACQSEAQQASAEKDNTVTQPATICSNYSRPTSCVSVPSGSGLCGMILLGRGSVIGGHSARVTRLVFLLRSVDKVSVQESKRSMRVCTVRRDALNLPVNIPHRSVFYSWHVRRPLD